MLLELNHTVSVCYCENHSVHFDWICNMYYNVQIMYLSTEKPLFEIIILPLSLATERATLLRKIITIAFCTRKSSNMNTVGDFHLI